MWIRWGFDADDDVLFIKSIPVQVEQSVDGLKKWARRNGHDRWWDEDEEAKSGLCAFLGAASNILHIVRIDTRMTYYPPVPAINTPRGRSPRVNCTAGKCTQRDSSRAIEVGPGELRSAGQTNKPFQTKKSHLALLSVTHIQREASPFNTLGWNANNLKPLSILQQSGDFTSAPNFHKRKEKPALLEIFSLFAKMLHLCHCHCTVQLMASLPTHEATKVR